MQPLRRNLGIRLCELETGLLSAKTGRERFPEALRHAPERGRNQLHLPPVAQGGDARKLGGGDARRVPVCLQGAHADHPYQPPEGIRIHRGILPRHRAAAGHAPAGSGAVSVAAEFQSSTRRCWPRSWRSCRETFALRFEFRNTTWLTDEVYRLLEKHGVALCLAESDKFEVPEVITAPFVYARLRKEEYSAGRPPPDRRTRSPANGRRPRSLRVLQA